MMYSAGTIRIPVHRSSSRARNRCSRGPGFSILNYETTVFDLTRSGRLIIHTAGINRLSPGTVHFSCWMIPGLKSDIPIAAAG